jgi:hypothetical protein
MANNVGRKGDVHDFGATFPKLVRVSLRTQFGTGPTAGNVVEVAWASSHDNSNFDTQTAAGDGAFSDADLFEQLHKVGMLPADNTTSQQAKSWVFYLPARYGYPVVLNRSGQALGSTAGNHVLTVTPLIGDIA